MSRNRSVAQQKLQEKGSRLKDQPLRVVESTMANRLAGEAIFWTSDGEVWLRHHGLPQHDFYMQ